MTVGTAGVGADVGGADGGVAAVEDDAGLARILRVVAVVDPGLDAAVVRAVVGRVVDSRSARLRVARELEAQPGLLTSGRPGGCTATHRLVAALAATGPSAVRAPHCTLCRRVTDLPVGLDGDGRACTACHDRLLAQHCPGCGEARPIGWRRADGVRVCLPCHNRQRAIHAKVACCPACGSTRLLSRTRTDGTRICRACDRRELAEWTRGWLAHFRRDRGSRVPGVAQSNDKTRTALILAAVAAADPSLPEQVGREVLARVAPTPQARGWLARDLTKHPDVLSSGRPDGSGAMQRLIAELLAAGSTGVRAPHCTLCRRIRALPVSLRGGGRVCGPCRDRLTATLCPGCGNRRRAAVRSPDGTDAVHGLRPTRPVPLGAVCSVRAATSSGAPHCRRPLLRPVPTRTDRPGVRRVRPRRRHPPAPRRDGALSTLRRRTGPHLRRSADSPGFESSPIPVAGAAPATPAGAARSAATPGSPTAALFATAAGCDNDSRT